MDKILSEKRPSAKWFSGKSRRSGRKEGIVDMGSPHVLPEHEAESSSPTYAPPMPDYKTNEPEKNNEEDEAAREVDVREKVDDSVVPQVPVTLETMSREIDQFLSTLSDRRGAKVSPMNESTDEQVGERVSDEDLHIEVPGFVEKFLDLVEDKLQKHEQEGNLGISDNGSSSLIEPANQISKLTSLVEFRSDSNHHLDSLINRIERVQQRAMLCLEEEFRLGLEGYRREESECSPRPREGDPSDDPSFLGYSDAAIPNLSKIAKEMIAEGYESECCQVYAIARRSAFDGCLSKLGFQKMSIDEVQKAQPDVLEREISSWIDASRKFSTIYFPNDRKLAESIFSDHASIAASLFSNLSRGVMIRLLNFAEAIAMIERSETKLFKYLDMYQTLRDCQEAMNGLFPEECESELRSEVLTARSRIGEAIITMFTSLESSMKHPGVPLSSGAVHQVTHNTMSYLTLACEQRQTLDQIFQESSRKEGIQNDETESQFSKKTNRILHVLDSTLENMSLQYKQSALRNIFLMNNGVCIANSIRKSKNLQDTIGDTFRRKKSRDIRNFHIAYKRETCSSLLDCAKPEGFIENGRVVKQSLKEKFKNFNQLFDEIHKTQRSWIVCDPQLQSELRAAVSMLLIPAYGSLLHYSSNFSKGKQTEKYVKYHHPDDLQSCIDELLDGKQGGKK